MRQTVISPYFLAPFWYIYRIYMVIVFFVVWVIFYPFVHFNLNKKERHPRAFKVKVLWCRVLSSLFFVRFKIHGKEHLKDCYPYIACINHQSYLDIIFMFPVLTDYFKFMGKSELRKWLMVGVFFRKGMDISVNRENAKEARVSLDEAMEALDEGIAVAIFPEGMIPEDSPQLKRFKNGAFKMALTKQVPILPITFLYNHERMANPYRFLSKASPGTCEVIVHPPIYTTGMDMLDLSPLREKVYEVINTPLVERGLSQSRKFERYED
jgi:1-acyl-sn-glycerol-3-phosphate acyltransferase